MSYPPHLDGSHVTDLLRSDLRLFVGCGLMLRISCACRDGIRQLCVQSIGIHYALSDLIKSMGPWYTAELFWVFWERSLRETSTGFCQWRFDDFFYISGRIRIPVSEGLYVCDDLDLYDSASFIRGRHNLRVGKLWTRNMILWRIYLNLESLT